MAFEITFKNLERTRKWLERFLHICVENLKCEFARETISNKKERFNHKLLLREYFRVANHPFCKRNATNFHYLVRSAALLGVEDLIPIRVDVWF